MRDTPDTPETSQTSDDQGRIISDADALQALGHPVRLALLEALLSGPLTATQAGELIGETSTTCSFHLRQLARYGFVEEAGGGKGRARPWRRVHAQLRIASKPDDSEYTKASQVVHEVMLDRYFQRVRSALLRAPNEPDNWREALIGTEMIFFLTAAELREVSEALEKLRRKFVERWGERSQPGLRPNDARAVELLFFGIPVSNDTEERS